MDKKVKLLIIGAEVIVTLVLVLLIVAGAVALFVIPMYNGILAPSTPSVIVTFTPTPAPSDTRAGGQTLGSMPVHHVSGKVFDDDTHTVLITTDSGSQVWASTGANGEYQADVQTTGKSFTVTVYENHGASIVYIGPWHLFSTSGEDVVNVNSSNM